MGGHIYHPFVQQNIKFNKAMFFSADISPKSKKCRNFKREVKSDKNLKGNIFKGKKFPKFKNKKRKKIEYF